MIVVGSKCLFNVSFSCANALSFGKVGVIRLRSRVYIFPLIIVRNVATFKSFAIL